MTRYTQLTQEQQYQIYALNSSHHCYPTILKQSHLIFMDAIRRFNFVASNQWNQFPSIK